MLRIGLTGGLACGKSTVAQMFGARGAHVLDADLVVRELMLPGEPVYREVLKAFGREILKTDGSEKIDRARLAEAAFEGGKIKLLNELVHPAVLRSQQEWMSHTAKIDPRGIAVVEAALIVEAGSHTQFDKLVVVTCSPQQKIERYILRSRRLGLPHDDDALREQGRRRIKAQMSDDEKSRVADYVIHNDGAAQELQQQFDAMFAELAQIATDAAATQDKTGNAKPSL